jgi:hypothetical protein
MNRVPAIKTNPTMTGSSHQFWNLETFSPAAVGTARGRAAGALRGDADGLGWRIRRGAGALEVESGLSVAFAGGAELPTFSCADASSTRST